MVRVLLAWCGGAGGGLDSQRVYNSRWPGCQGIPVARVGSNAYDAGMLDGGIPAPSLPRRFQGRIAAACAAAYAAHAMAHVPLTRPSHATILSGLLPWELGVRDNLSPAQLPPSPLLAEILKDAGFKTAAFVSSMVLDRRGGFGRGFDRYEDSFPKTEGGDVLATAQRPGADTVRAAIAWLEAQRDAD